jgi:haloalkane dehalogenase
MTASADPRYPRAFAEVCGDRMAYVDVGDGDPIVFLHGNPTSSYLWRNVMPYLEGLGRLIAPDLIGMGDSAKLSDSGPARYTFVEHRRYLDKLLDELGVSERATFVGHDWGAALAFDWANRHRQAVKGIAYMEAVVRPLLWSNWPEAQRSIFQAFRSPAGEELILTENRFVESVLPGGMLRALTDEELAQYRRPYVEPGEGRRPTLTWPRQIPIDGEPADVVEIVCAYDDWLSSSSVPKLFINAAPGAIITGTQRELCRTWPNQTEVTVPGIHFVQEDSPDLIGEALSAWYRTLADGRAASGADAEGVSAR